MDTAFARGESMSRVSLSMDALLFGLTGLVGIFNPPSRCKRSRRHTARCLRRRPRSTLRRSSRRSLLMCLLRSMRTDSSGEMVACRGASQCPERVDRRPRWNWGMWGWLASSLLSFEAGAREATSWDTGSLYLKAAAATDACEGRDLGLEAGEW